MSINPERVNESNQISSVSIANETEYIVKDNDHLICVTGGCIITIPAFKGTEFKIGSTDTNSVVVKDFEGNILTTINAAMDIKTVNIDLESHYFVK